MINKEAVLEARAAKVQELMKQHDMTMARLQRRTKLHINTIRNVVKEQKDVKTLTLIAIAEGFDIPPSMIL